MKNIYEKSYKLKKELDKIHPLRDLAITFYPSKKILSIAIFIDNKEDDTLIYQKDDDNLPSYDMLLFDLQVLLSEFIHK